MVAGDETSLDLQLGAGAVCFLGTQASTKIYRNPAGRPCGHRLRADLGSGSLLIAAPDPVQAFAGSQYTQHQEFDLAPDANLVLIDWLSSGRVARGERWAFRRFASRNEVRVGGARQWLDSLVLDHEQGPLEAGYRMGRYDCLALVYMTGPQVAEGAARWLAEVEAAPVTRLASLLCSASVHRNGHLFRLAGSSAEAVGQHMGRHLKFVSNLLHDDPWARKW